MAGGGLSKCERCCGGGLSHGWPVVVLAGGVTGGSMELGVATKSRKWKVDRSDTSDDNSGYRRNALTNALDRIYGAGSLESAAGSEIGAVAAKAEPASRKTRAKAMNSATNTARRSQGHDRSLDPN
jgi:hypothetical protein